MADTPGFTAGRPVTQLPIDDETAPKRGRGRPPGSKTSPSAPSRRSLEQQLAQTIFMVNLAAASVTANTPLQADVLDGDEIVALARAIDQQCKTSPRFRKVVEGALNAGSGLGLIGVIAIIGGRRLARHGVISPAFEPELARMVGQYANAKREPEKEPAAA